LNEYKEFLLRKNENVCELWAVVKLFFY